MFITTQTVIMCFNNEAVSHTKAHASSANSLRCLVNYYEIKPYLLDIVQRVFYHLRLPFFFYKIIFSHTKYRHINKKKSNKILRS
jgi:hypothetical protein